ncbi:8963_t:CDS:1, partial [Diversispora eburnea]
KQEVHETESGEHHQALPLARDLCDYATEESYDISSVSCS